jgi:glyoxylase-like metal-dependent hydrolase (beta-lactamase superfamily II)
MDAQRLVARRTFLADMGRGAVALAVVSIAGCAPAAQATAGRSSLLSASPSSGDPPGASTAPGASSSSDASASSSTGASSPPSSGGDAVAWTRVNLGFVSAYILARGGEAAIVDTGVGGSADDIEASLMGIGLAWDDVAHLILTHKHGDHIGSAADVMTSATGATAYAGQEDIGAITVPRGMTAVGDGDSVFGLTIVTTPGHTPGSISVFDPVGGLLVAGDAMGTSGGKPIPPGAQFTEDPAVAKQSIVKLGGLTFETLLVGHGDPIESGASKAVAELGAS